VSAPDAPGASGTPGPPGAAEIEQARADVAAVSRQLAALGMVPATAGNVSVRVGDLVAITPTGAALRDLVADDVTVVDLDGAVVEGRLAPTSELGLHLGIYRARDAGAVVHTHAPACTAAACVLDELPCFHYQLLSFGGSVPVAPYATFGSEELAANVVAALERRTAALMASHGAVTCAATPAKAFEAMELLEWACDVYGRAQALGTPRAMTDAQIEATIAAAIANRYGAPRPAGGNPS
jgi:L-fuculose-phosphate aldolase